LDPVRTKQRIPPQTENERRENGENLVAGERFRKDVIDRIVLREMVTAVLGGKRIKIDGLLAVNLNYGNVVYESQIPVAEALVDIQIDYVLGNGKW